MLLDPCARDAEVAVDFTCQHRELTMLEEFSFSLHITGVPAAVCLSYTYSTLQQHLLDGRERPGRCKTCRCLCQHASARTSSTSLGLLLCIQPIDQLSRKL